jgi:hypothetical protein
MKLGLTQIKGDAPYYHRQSGWVYSFLIYRKENVAYHPFYKGDNWYYTNTQNEATII